VDSNRTKEFFSRYAVDFDSIYGTTNRGLSGLINKTLRRSMMLRYMRTLEHCQPVEGHTVLDVGCGPGHYCISLAQAGAKHCTGVDFAPGMLAIAKARAVDAKVGDRCSFLEMDIMAFPDTQRFDFVVGMGLMDYIGEPMPLLEKLLRLVNRRAMFSFPAAGGFLAWQRKIRYRSRCELYFYSEQKIAELFTNFSNFEYRIEKISRDYFVLLQRR
jgi:ubiquinone/menaquinone biosynthesis C-methylase UbiE